ncbi:MAG: glutamate--tRNA ligase [Thermodesulfobacteriota bacterium]
MKQIVTRFPPSPTGTLHLGGARTALFNWLYARKNNGKFIFRLEDTDLERSRQEYVDQILCAMEWLGLSYDEGPYYQTKRFDVYREFAKKLYEAGKAYYCTCTPEELDAMREKAMAEGGKPKYDGRCREKKLPPGPGAALRLKIPLTGHTSFTDVVRGRITFPNEELDDLVILRSDGTPTYHLAVVVDDITMGVNTIIRGDDHVSNTPRQVLIYQALEEPLPVYAHVPMVLGPDKKKLSKRHGAASVMEYRDMGFLPEALLNFLARLGWSCGDQEFFTREDLVEKFSLENLGRSAGVFDADKLLDLNAAHIRAASPESLQEPLLYHLRKMGLPEPAPAALPAIIRTLQPRSKTLAEMAEKAAFYLRPEVAFDEKAVEKHLNTEAEPLLAAILDKVSRADFGDEKALEAAFAAVMETFSLGFGKLAHPVRVALTGGTVSPGMFEMMQALGKEKTLDRISDALDRIRTGRGFRA